MTKNKKNLGLKVLSTTAALAVLVSSVATPVSVFANETKENIQGSTKVVANSIIAPSTLNLLIDQDEATLLKVFRNNAKVMHGDAHEIGNPLCVYKDYTLTVSGVNYKVAGTYNALFRASFGKDSVSKYIEVKVAGTGSGTGTGTNYQPFTDAYSKIFPSGQTEPIETATSNDIYNLMYLAQQYKNELGDYLYNYFLDNMVRGLDYISINTVMKSLNNLFSDKTQSQLAVNVTQKTIDEARTKVEGIVFNKLPESAKNELFNVVQKAQDLLTAKDETNKAEENVNNLFADKEHTTLADGITQKDIDVAKEAANKVTDKAKKEELLNEIQKAQDLLTAKDETNKAEENVNNLFADKEHTTLADGITQKDIDVAKEAANKVTDKAKKEELLNEIQKAQDLLTAKDETNKAEENVNNLFADKEHTTLAEGVTQQDIDAAKEAANKVTDKAKKEELLNEIQKAQDLLTAQDETNKAEENVNNLFADDEHTTLAEGVTQQDIDAAKEAANKVTDKAKKEELLNEIQKAQDLLTAKEEQKAVENVNNLFADGEHTTLADGITQKDIDVAKEAVNKLTDEAKKEELLNEIQKAQDLLTAKEEAGKVAEDVNNLFADKEHTTLADGITQKDIDVAKEAVNKLTDEAKKEELLNEIQKAQDLLTAKEEAGKVAEDVNNLFADKEHTTLADGITQKDIDVAKDQVNKLTDGAKKEELLNEIQKAQDLLTAKEEQKVAEDVNNLFADDEHTILADGITQKDIDVAKDQVNKLIDEAKKEELLNEIQKAQDLLNEMNKLTLNTLTAHSSEISGSARANSQLRISINGVAKTVIKADSEGKYEWRVSKLAVNDVIKVEMRNPETNKYDQFVDQRITDSGVTEEKITLNGMQEGDTKISGTTTPNAQVRINFDGKPKNIVTSDAQGNYEFVVASGLTTGTEIKVELKSKGTYSISETKTVIARVLTLNPITSADDVVISGKTRNPNQKLRISLNGKAKTIISSKEGVYEYRMGKVAADSAIKVEAMNGSTVIESVEQIVKGISNEERPDVKLDAIEAGTRTTITGKAPAKASLRISINGKTKSVVAADAEGNFSYMLGKVQAGDKVKIEIREGKTFVFATEVAAH